MKSCSYFIQLCHKNIKQITDPCDDDNGLQQERWTAMEVAADGDGAMKAGHGELE